MGVAMLQNHAAIDGGEGGVQKCKTLMPGISKPPSGINNGPSLVRINFIYKPARWRGVEFLPCVSRQLIFSGVASFCTLARLPFLAASNNAASPVTHIEIV